MISYYANEAQLNHGWFDCFVKSMPGKTWTAGDTAKNEHQSP
jgi:hypothetical protein